MKPGRMRTEMVSSTVSMVAVCDGEHVYNYMPRLNQVHARSAAALAAIGDSIGLAQALATGTPLERPVSLATGLRQARFLPPQTVRRRSGTSAARWWRPSTASCLPVKPRNLPTGCGSTRRAS